MLGLPKSTEISKQLPKKAIYEKFKPSPSERKLFDEQINRLSIVAEISPQTVAIAAGADVAAIYVVAVTLKTPECDKKNIALLSKLIEQNMLFVLQHEQGARLAVYRAGKVFVSERKPLDEWIIPLTGLDLGAVWDNIIAQIGGIDTTNGKNVDEAIAEAGRRARLERDIAALEKKIANEKQFNIQVELNSKMKKLREELADG